MLSDLLTLEADFDRGEILDVLIKFDEKRFEDAGEGAEGASDNVVTSSGA